MKTWERRSCWVREHVSCCKCWNNRVGVNTKTLNLFLHVQLHVPCILPLRHVLCRYIKRAITVTKSKLLWVFLRLTPLSTTKVYETFSKSLSDQWSNLLIYMCNQEVIKNILFNSLRTNYLLFLSTFKD